MQVSSTPPPFPQSSVPRAPGKGWGGGGGLSCQPSGANEAWHMLMKADSTCPSDLAIDWCECRRGRAACTCLYQSFLLVYSSKSLTGPRPQDTLPCCPPRPIPRPPLPPRLAWLCRCRAAAATSALTCSNIQSTVREHYGGRPAGIESDMAVSNACPQTIGEDF